MDLARLSERGWVRGLCDLMSSEGRRGMESGAGQRTR